jgi:hypothetical protein
MSLIIYQVLARVMRGELGNNFNGKNREPYLKSATPIVLTFIWVLN